MAIGKLVLIVKPSYFSRDMQIIESLKGLKTFEEIDSEMNYFRYCNPENDFLRGVMRIRMSHRKLKGIARKVMLT